MNCAIRELGDGRIRFILDDVSPEEDNPVRKWKKTFLFTWTDLEMEAFASGEAPDEFYCELGRMVAVRNHARRAVEDYDEA